ncbi:hypothetical protein SAMN05421770_101132 [Granulicella rosea]|uniref:Streptogramin lyase n=1 Tax=Granulicella rosea TaxID=474952 RepID=A0A239CX10_9BACT|nr:NHL repeat-containing protein [Granulicella rosea]SNS24074.1 hypothetical protein SAMN05421770_101132 [Granulicella rosea]
MMTANHVNTALRQRRRTLAAALALSIVALAATGCGIGLPGTADSTTSATALASSGIHGYVHGGQQPVSGGSIQLFAVGSSGYRSVATSLMNSGTTVTTGSDGSFNVTGKYTCPTANPAALTYMTASFGNPGLAAGANNTKLVLMAALGPCNTLLANFPFISVDEVTTVASVYALSAFMSDAAHIGAPSANLTGISNAFSLANTLANTGTGTAPSLNAPITSSIPVSEIYSIANTISTCVNSTGLDSNCSSLISLTTAGGITPVDTATAVLSMVRNPLNQVAALYNLAPSTPPFQPALTSAPADWTVAVKSTGGALSAPTGIAIDISGNAWVANASGNSITQFGPAGALLSGSTGYTATGLLGPQALAIDQSNNVWIANSTGGSVIKLTASSGLVLSATSYTAGGIVSPSAIALDGLGNVWAANYTTGAISGITSAGAAIPGSPFTASGTVSLPTGLAIDASNNVWISNSGSGVVSEISSSGATLSGAGYTDGSLLAPGGIARDLMGNTYVSASGINAVSVFGSTGSALTSSPVSGTISLPAGIAVDGANVAFIANSKTSGSLAMLTSPTGTPVSLGSLNAPVGVAVDGSGNVWTANSGDNSVTQFIGVGTPATVPLGPR